MQHSISQNMSQFDQIARLLIGTALILSVLLQPTTPVWFALLGAYAVLTAMLRWEISYLIIPRYQGLLHLNPAR